jgi:hypothetical protein
MATTAPARREKTVQSEAVKPLRLMVEEREPFDEKAYAKWRGASAEHEFRELIDIRVAVADGTFDEPG